MADARAVRARLYLLAARNGYRRGLQYRGAHMVNNLASALFGFVYIAVWRAALAGSARGGDLTLTPTWMAHYIALSQCLMWLTTFLPYGLGIPAAVRTGQVTADLMRPVGFWPLQMAREAGATTYSLLYRSLPMAAVFALAVGFPLPPSTHAAVAGCIAVACGVWNALCLNYLVGVSTFWTTEARAAHWLLAALIMNFGGGTIPFRAFPAVFRTVLPLLPFASLLSTPALAWMGHPAGSALLVSGAWALALGCLCTQVTRAARRRLEVQGG